VELILLIGMLSALALCFWLLWSNLASTTVFDYQNGLLYKNGSFVKVLGAGTYRYFAKTTKIATIDKRKTQLTLPNQEILTKDHVSVRVSLVGTYQVTDPVRAAHESANYMLEIYSHAQLALREEVAARSLDELLEKKTGLDEKLLSIVSARAADLGVTLTTLAVLDVMLPANLKRAFVGALEAQKEAQRQIEMARGEQAVLRSLANSAKLYEANPALLQARIIQALGTGNNSIVFGADGNTIVKNGK
jgi:regulator of protease activity HflC (stomatin/prohibitin superfamily)